MTWAHTRGVLVKMRFLAWASLVVFATALAGAVIVYMGQPGRRSDTLDLARVVLLGAEAALTTLWLLADSFRCTQLRAADTVSRTTAHRSSGARCWAGKTCQSRTQLSRSAC